jgi:nicotinamide riboside transporter PnuC
MIDALSWVCSGIALYGTWLNANARRDGFYWWVTADIGMTALFISLHLWAQATLFAIYTWLAFKGLREWKKR